MTKLTALLLFGFTLHVSATVVAQRITLHVKQAPLDEVMEELYRQSGYSFLVDKKLLRKAKPVSLQLDNADLEEALVRIFSGQPFGYELADKIITVKGDRHGVSRRVFLHQSWPIQEVVTGRVTDSLGNPLSNATVKIKGTNRTTFTNREGRFTLPPLENGTVLIISFLGYKEMEVAVTDQPINVKLQTTVATLDEAVVTTAYGLEKRTKELGYSVAKVTGEELNRTNPGNILTGLTGRVSGWIRTTTSCCVVSARSMRLPTINR